jgi:lysophospholipase L1-like esterase
MLTGMDKVIHRFSKHAVSVVFLLLIFSCTKSKVVNLPGIPFSPPVANTILTMLSLGDSYTIGQSVPVADRFPQQTVARLTQLNRQFAAPEYIAQTGWTTDNLLAAIQSANKPKNFDIVTLCIGVNNQYQGRDTALYRQQFIQSLQQAILHAANRKERVFVVSIPDYGATPFGQNQNPAKISREIDQFNNINQEISAAFGVQYIEITRGSRDAVSDPSLVASDGLHPSGKEYQKWAEKLTNQILTILR